MINLDAKTLPSALSDARAVIGNDGIYMGILVVAIVQALKDQHLHRTYDEIFDEIKRVTTEAADTDARLGRAK